MEYIYGKIYYLLCMFVIIIAINLLYWFQKESLLLAGESQHK